jgi:hypothetical protein
MHINSMLLTLKWDCHGELSQEDRNRVARALAGGDPRWSRPKGKGRREDNVLVFTLDNARHEELA